LRGLYFRQIQKNFTESNDNYHTHRLSLVRFVNRIIVRQDAQIERFDPHENPLGGSDYYRMIWKLQSERYLS
jgi:ABC-type multidrug transport system fused ATPase/permease subunit